LTFTLQGDDPILPTVQKEFEPIRDARAPKQVLEFNFTKDFPPLKSWRARAPNHI
jgi:hypothetical protein